jgi:hypothetical protein
MLLRNASRSWFVLTAALLIRWLSFLGPHKWAGILSVSITMTIATEAGGVYIRPVQGNLSPDLANLATWVDSSPPTPLLPRSHLFGVMSWTEREILRRKPWQFITVSYEYVKFGS